MEVVVPESVHVLALVAAHLAMLEAVLGAARAGRPGAALALALDQAVRPHEAQEAAIRRERPELRLRLHDHLEVLVAQHVRPARVLAMLRDREVFQLLLHDARRAAVGAHLARQRRHRIAPRALRLVVPFLDRRAPEARRLTGDRVHPRLRRQARRLRAQLALLRRRGQKRTHHAESELRPLYPRGRSVIFRHRHSPFRATTTVARKRCRIPNAHSRPINAHPLRE